MNTLGERMKQYESVSKTTLVSRMPIIIRLDGVAFHTFTKGLEKPFCEVLTKTMEKTMEYLCRNIQGCVFGYTQSDEITLVLVDYKTLNSKGWFGNEVQKMCSVSASMATMYFNSVFRKYVEEIRKQTFFDDNEQVKRLKIFENKVDTARFDSRCFNVPKEDVTNCILWRQNDGTRNSIQALGQAHFSHKRLQGKNCNEIQDMLFCEHKINWNDLPTKLKRGSCCIRDDYGKWFIDTEIPIFKGESGREYIEELINVGE